MAQLIYRVTGQTLKLLVRAYKSNVSSFGVKKFGFVHARPITTTPIIRADRLFTEKHEWIEVKGKIGIVGISNYAQDALGDVVYAQLPDVGSSIKKDEEVGALESVKAASEIISPISGIVIAKNEAVENKPSLINSSCYKDGWLFKVQIVNLDEIKSLMDEKSYEDFLKTDPH